jgi:hypothetical protein
MWPTALATGVTVAVLILAAIHLASGAPLTVVVQSPILVDGSGRVSTMNVTVANASDSLLTPRFAVQHGQTYTNPVTWRIEAGPAALQPGQVGQYRITAPEDVDSFYVGSSGQVVVTDGNNRYALRGLTTIQADRSFLWPDMIANPTYAFWDANQDGPLYWTPIGSGLIAMVRKDGRDALELTSNIANNSDSRVALETQTIFPTAPFTIAVYPDAGDLTFATKFGIEINDGKHFMELIFGGMPSSSDPPAQYVVNLSVPPGQWSEVTIDLAHLYDLAGWPLPPLRQTIFRDVEAD